ncbi:MAG: hypothetical protein LBF23_01110 [Endomicrobium sp.]|nr:hypothetical protein [Endomicrobium sp.]
MSKNSQQLYALEFLEKPYKDKIFEGANRGYIQIYHKIAAKRAIKGLQKAVGEGQISQEPNTAKE